MDKKKQIIIRPIMTEKMSRLEDTQRKFAFQVDSSINKIEIKKAIEKKFNVKVSNVHTMNIKGKSKSMTIRSGGRVIRTSGRRANWKKAIVTLQEGFKIDLYESEVAR